MPSIIKIEISDRNKTFEMSFTATFTEDIPTLPGDIQKQNIMAQEITTEEGTSTVDDWVFFYARSAALKIPNPDNLERIEFLVKISQVGKPWEESFVLSIPLKHESYVH